MEQRHLLNHELARTAGMLSGARRGAMMLVATLLFTLTAQTAWAQELLTSGKCGVNEDNAGLVWSFDTGTKTLTISLEGGYTDGEMAYYYPNYVYEDLGGGDYDENKPAPWRKYTDHEGNLNNGPGDLIEHIVVEEGVYRISNNAFCGLANLKDVTLASTVYQLGEGAMQNDPKLTSVILLCPAFISGYGYAFDDSDQLTIYAIKQQASNFEYNYSNINMVGFLLTGNGYKATPKKATRELLDVQRGYYTDFCTLTLNGDHTATINGKNYTIKSGTEISASYYDGVIKEDTQEALDFDEVTETGKYRYKVQVKNMFADEANENVVSDLFTVTSSPTSGEGWAFNIEKSTLTISGNVTGEPWLPFANNINNVFVDQNVTQMPANAFTDRNAYNSLRRVILRSTAVVDLNGSFSNKYEVWNEEAQDYVKKDRLVYNIYVPSSILDSYKNNYASWLEGAYYNFYPIDISVTLPASGVMTYSNDNALDFTNSEGLKAYVASEFIPATGKVVMNCVKTVRGQEGLVLKGTPGATYTFEIGIDDSWVENLLQYGDDAVDPAGDAYYTYLQLDGTEFKKFTEVTNLEGQAYLMVGNVAYEGATTPITMFFSDEDIMTSGVVNDNCYWSYDADTKTLTLSGDDTGTGSFAKEYDPTEYRKPAPWRNWTTAEGVAHKGVEDGIEHIVVENGVNYIGSYAFYGLKNLEDVTLASTVNQLGEGTMQNNPKLTSVILLCPSFVYDYYYAFDDSDLLTIYAIKGYASQYANNFKGNYPNITVKDFLLTGNGYKATPNKATRELLDLQHSSSYDAHCTLTLNGDHTATINGKDYTIKSGTEIRATYYAGVIKEGTLETLDFDEVTETGDYRYNVQVKNMFADEANENVVSDPFTVTNSPTSGEGWAFDFDKRSLTISGNVTGEPWLPFANNINNVFVEQNVTQMPANAFTDRNAYYSLRRVILRSPNMMTLNGAFSVKYEAWDYVAQGYVEKYYLGYDIYVPSSIVESYRTTYASLLENTYHNFYPIDISVTLPASGVMTYSNDNALDFTHSEGLKAYIASEFIPATGKVIMNRVMTARTCTGLVLKGTPGTTYTFEIGVDDSWVNNMLGQGYDAVDPTGNADCTYLQLDGTEFKKFTEETNLEGQAYLLLENDDYEAATTPITMLFSDEEAVTSGVVNGNCYWSYDADTKTLTLSGDNVGTGYFAKEYNPTNYEIPAPWRNWTTAEGVIVRKGVEEGIEHIVVENGVNYIGDYAFYGLENLESVSLAPSVYSLYEGALQGCSKLKTVVCSYLYTIDVDTEDDTYSVANVGETYYVPNYRKTAFENKLKAFNNVKVEGFYLSEGTLKVDFFADPLTLEDDHYTGDISMVGYWKSWIEDAKATVNGIEYTYSNKNYADPVTYYYRKDNQDPDLEWNEVTEPGKYYVKVTVEGYFADEAKNTAISEHYADLYVAPSSGDGWNFDRKHNVLTISGDVTGEPWELFKNNIRYVVVEEGVTKLPEKALYNHYLDYAIIKGTGVDLNKAFLCTDEVYDELNNCWIKKELLYSDIYVPAASVADYNAAYADYLVEYGGKILSSDISIDITEASEGIRTYSDWVALDISACEGLHAYTITNFNATTGALTLKPVTKMANYAGYLLMGETGTYTAKVTAGVDWEKDNMLRMADYADPEGTMEGVTYTNFILAGSGTERGFHPLSTGGDLPNHVAILLIKKEDFEAWKGSGAAPLHLEIDGADVTAISTMKVISTPADDAWYTISGVRMEGKPAQKGVYIHQGKLIVIK